MIFFSSMVMRLGRLQCILISLGKMIHQVVTKSLGQCYLSDGDCEMCCHHDRKDFLVQWCAELC